VKIGKVFCVMRHDYRFFFELANITSVLNLTPWISDPKKYKEPNDARRPTIIEHKQNNVKLL